MPEAFRLNLSRLVAALGLKENLIREVNDRVSLVMDVTQFLDLTEAGQAATILSPLIRYIAPTTPLAGADWSVVVPPGVKWRIKYLSGQLVTSAVVGVRQPNMTVSTPIPTTLGDPAPFAQAAGQTIYWEWINPGNDFDSGAIAAPGIRVFHIAFPDIFGFAGATIGPITAGLLAGDQWSLLGCAFEEFPA